jgi:hypothetical protein
MSKRKTPESARSDAAPDGIPASARRVHATGPLSIRDALFADGPLEYWPVGDHADREPWATFVTARRYVARTADTHAVPDDARHDGNAHEQDEAEN